CISSATAATSSASSTAIAASFAAARTSRRHLACRPPTRVAFASCTRSRSCDRLDYDACAADRSEETQDALEWLGSGLRLGIQLSSYDSSRTLACSPRSAPPSGGGRVP